MHEALQGKLTKCVVLNSLQGECGSDSLVLMLMSLVNEVKADARCCYRALENHAAQRFELILQEKTIQYDTGLLHMF